MQPSASLADVSLQAKAFVQPLGSENAWNELGEGRFELHGHIIRVVVYETVPCSNNGMTDSPDSKDSNEGVECLSSSGSLHRLGSDGVAEDPIPKAAAEEEPVAGTPPLTDDASKSSDSQSPPSGDGSNSPDRDGGAGNGKGSANTNNNLATVMSIPINISPTVVMEDSITNETPFVAKDGCLVWNSPDQNLSLCVMFVSELGFTAAWSAILSTQQNPYPPIEFDVFQPRSGSRLEAALEADVSNRETAESAQSVEAQRERIREVLHPNALLKYSYVEKHCIACSIMEKDMGRGTPLFSDPACCLTLLKLGHQDLVEYLATDEVFDHFVKGLGYTGPLPQKWVCPDGLVPQSSMDTLINTSLRIHHVKNQVLPLSDDETSSVLDALQHRLQNEIVCTLIADEAILRNAIAIIGKPRSGNAELAAAEEEAVSVQLKFLTNLFSLATSAFAKELIPHLIAKIFAFGLVPAIGDMCTNYLCSSGGVADRSTPTASTCSDPPLSPKKQPNPEGSLASIATLTGSFGGKPPLGTGATGSALHSPSDDPIPTPIVIPSQTSGDPNVEKDKDITVKPLTTSDSGDIPAAEKKESRQSRRAKREENSGSRSGSRAPKFCMPVSIEKELSRLLEETVNKLNEKGEERTLCEIFRNTISSDTSGHYTNFMQFLLRSQTTGSPLSQNKMILYHLLGLHDDEGSGTDRNSDLEAVEGRNAFQKYFITKILPDAIRSRPLTSSSSSKNRLQSPTTTSTAAGGGGANTANPTAHRARRHSNSSSLAPVAGSSPGATHHSGLLSQGLIRILEYLYINASLENRKDLTKVLFTTQGSSLLKFLVRDLPAAPAPEGDAPYAAPKLSSVFGRPESTSAKAESPSSAKEKSSVSKLTAVPCRKECLVQNLRFIKAALAQSTDPIVARSFTLEKDVFYGFLTLADLGHQRSSNRHQNMLQSTVLSLLQMLLMKEHLRDLRQFLVAKHRALLPAGFTSWVDRESVLWLELKMKGTSVEETEHALQVLSRAASSRSASPHLHQGLLIDNGSPIGPKKDRVVIDEANWHMHGTEHTMEEVAGFPVKLRHLIERISPTPGSSPSDSQDKEKGQEKFFSSSSDSETEILLESGASSSRGNGNGKKSSGAKTPTKDSNVATGSATITANGGGKPSPKQSTLSIPLQSNPSDGKGNIQNGAAPRPAPPKKKPHAPPTPRRAGSGGRRRSGSL